MHLYKYRYYILKIFVDSKQRLVADSEWLVDYVSLN